MQSVAAGTSVVSTMTEFDQFGNTRIGASALGLHLYLEDSQSPGSYVGGRLALAEAEGGGYSVTILGTLAGLYSLAVRFNESTIEAGGSATMRIIPVNTPLEMTVMPATISAIGSQVVSDAAAAPGWTGGDMNGFVDLFQDGFYSAQNAVNKLTLKARDRSAVVVVLFSRIPTSVD